MRNRIAFIFQLVISLALLLLLARGVVWTEIVAAASQVPWTLFVAAFVVTAVGQALYAVKWYVALRVMDVPARFGRVLGQYVIGMFFNNFLPSTIGGDWAKVYYLGRSEGYVRVGASVFIDRYLGALFLVAFAALLLWLPENPQRGAWQPPRMGLTGAAVALAGGGILALLIPPGRLAGRFTSSAGLIGRVCRQVSLFADHVRSTLRHPYAMVIAAVVVAAYFVLLAVVYRALIESVTGRVVGFVPVLTAVAVIAAVSMIPISVNGIGVREQMHVLLFGAVGISAEEALVVSLVVFVQLLILSAAGFLLWVRQRRPVAAAASVPGAKPAETAR